MVTKILGSCAELLMMSTAAKTASYRMVKESIGVSGRGGFGESAKFVQR